MTQRRAKRLAAAVAWQCVSSQAVANRWAERLDWLSEEDRGMVHAQLKVLVGQLVRRQGQEFVPVLRGVRVDSERGEK